MVKTALIIDASQAYLNFQVDRVLNRWNISKTSTQKSDSLALIGGESLFGDIPTGIIHLPDTNSVKKFIEDFNRITDVDSTLEAGLIVTCSANRNGTRKLESTFRTLEGEIYIPPGKSDDPIAVKLLSELNITPEVRKFMLNHVGDDYDSLLPIVDSLSELPRASHKKVTEEDIYIRFPQPPGAVPPWEIKTPLMEGDVPRTIDLFRRISKHSSHLVIIALLKNELQLVYRVAELLNENKNMSSNTIASILDITPGRVFYISKTVKKLELEVIRGMLEDIVHTEALVKGGSTADSMILVEMFLVKTCLRFR